MDYKNKTDEELIHDLEMAGRTPHPTLIEAFLARRDTLAPALVPLFAASQHDDWDEEDPRWYRLIHFGRLLIAFREPTALPVFEELFTRPNSDDMHVLEWFELDLAHYGPTAVPTLLRISQQDAGNDFHYGRSLATGTLAVIAYHHPELRDGIITALLAQLPPLKPDGTPDTPADQINEHWTEVVMALADLGDEAGRPIIEALFQHGLIEEGIITLENYRDSFAENGSPFYDDVPVDILTNYRELYEHEQKHQQTAARRDLLRAQGFTPPVIAQPAQSRLNDWVNDKLVKAPAPLTAKPKIGRNDPCPCGSGLKYKKCHGKPGAPPL